MRVAYDHIPRYRDSKEGVYIRVETDVIIHSGCLRAIQSPALLSSRFSPLSRTMSSSLTQQIIRV
jgi:hypothetical protein